MYLAYHWVDHFENKYFTNDMVVAVIAFGHDAHSHIHRPPGISIPTISLYFQRHVFTVRWWCVSAFAFCMAWSSTADVLKTFQLCMRRAHIEALRIFGTLSLCDWVYKNNINSFHDVFNRPVCCLHIHYITAIILVFIDVRAPPPQIWHDIKMHFWNTSSTAKWDSIDVVMSMSRSLGAFTLILQMCNGKCSFSSGEQQTKFESTNISK